MKSIVIWRASVIALACAYLCSQCLTLMASVNSANVGLHNTLQDVTFKLP